MRERRKTFVRVLCGHVSVRSSLLEQSAKIKPLEEAFDARDVLFLGIFAVVSTCKAGRPLNAERFEP